MADGLASAQQSALRQALDEIVATVRGFVRSPRALWGVNVPYFLEGIAYFGVLTLLMKYLSENVALGDVKAGIIVSFFTGGITFAQLFLGELGDRFGLRRVLLLSIVLLACGRIFIVFAGWLPGGTLTSPAFLMTAVSLLVVVVAFGMFQPALFSALKQFSTPESSAVAFAVIYGLNNLGAFVAGAISPKIRVLATTTFPPNGINGVFAVYTVLTFLSIVITMAILTKATVARALASRPDSAASEEKARQAERPRVLSRRWLAEHPLADGRFAFFVFILIPVQTLFAHQWLTLPLYINRAFVPWVANRFELFTNLGPLLVFLLAPLVAALTARRDPLKMMQWGTLVMAAPTFLLVLGPSPAALFAYVFLMTVGESMWQPRFYSYITEIAPPGKAGLYVGVGQLPWFLTKFLTGLYAGWFLQRYCPAGGTPHTERMWLIYAFIAMVSPVALFLTRNWLRAGAKSAGAQTS
jgi:POT family proton-dependent oligopeptide transporter